MGAAQHKITGGLSMAYFGFYTQEHMAGVAAVLREMGYYGTTEQMTKNADIIQV